jgi:hypothetical protein
MEKCSFKKKWKETLTIYNIFHNMMSQQHLLFDNMELIMEYYNAFHSRYIIFILNSLLIVLDFFLNYCYLWLHRSFFVN